MHLKEKTRESERCVYRRLISLSFKLFCLARSWHDETHEALIFNVIVRKSAEFTYNIPRIN